VLELDLPGRSVRFRRADGAGEASEAFDHLLIATGAAPIRPPVPGIDGSGVYAVNTLQGGIDLSQRLDSDKPRRVAIIGGGYIGLEMTEAMLLRGLDVSLVDMLPQVMGTLDPDMAEPVAAALKQAGVELHLEEKLEGFDLSDGKLAAVITDKGRLPVDLAILGLGVRPNTALAKHAGIALGVRESIKVDDRMQTDVEGVWAAGDCVESRHLVSRRPFWVALGSVANKQGRVAGVNIGGGNTVFPGIVGTAVTKFMDTEIARTGLQERELEDLNIDYVTARINSRARSGYYPGASPIAVKLYAERGSGRLVGGQIVGGAGSAKRIDIIATALHAGLTIEDLLNLDLGYAPPYSPVWDPVLIAARQTLKLL
jgi:NADPH-dependent 2,4-dienoyl-CoA reductase/sulfur reductase-like enzyme